MSKSIAIMPTPSGCARCVFGVCKFQYPWWCREESGRGKKGFYCQLDEQHRVLEMDIDDDTTKAEWCSLKPYEGGADK